MDVSIEVTPIRADTRPKNLEVIEHSDTINWGDYTYSCRLIDKVTVEIRKENRVSGVVTRTSDNVLPYTYRYERPAFTFIGTTIVGPVLAVYETAKDIRRKSDSNVLIIYNDSIIYVDYFRSNPPYVTSDGVYTYLLDEKNTYTLEILVRISRVEQNTEYLEPYIIALLSNSGEKVHIDASIMAMTSPIITQMFYSSEFGRNDPVIATDMSEETIYKLVKLYRTRFYGELVEATRDDSFDLFRYTDYYGKLVDFSLEEAVDVAMFANYYGDDYLLSFVLWNIRLHLHGFIAMLRDRYPDIEIPIISALC